MPRRSSDLQLTLAEKYTPVRLGDLVGQDWARRAIGGLILRGKLERQLLLQGAHGSGKTSLAHIYARALACENINPDGDGSPCLACDACGRPEVDRMAKFDVAGFGGSEETIEKWVKPYRNGIAKGRKLLFFDECHAMSPKAQDSILKFVEDPPPGIVTCFATTEPWHLHKTLRSRLMQISVRELSRGQSLQYLERIAVAEQMTFEPAALAMLAGIKKGFPRDLIMGLAQVAGNDRNVTLDAVRGHFDIDDVDHLFKYMGALISGSPQDQRDAFSNWRLPDEQKVDWIRSYLTSTYYNQVIGIDTVVEPMLHADNRCRILYEAFEERAVAARQRPERLWVRLKEFWLNTYPVTGLQIAMFEELINEALRPRAHQGEAADTSPATTAPVRSRIRTVAQQPVTVAAQTDFIGLEDVRSILNRASSFVQHHGLLMNVAIEIRPSHGLRAKGLPAAEAIYGFADELERRFADEAFAAIVLVERDEAGINGRIAAHIAGLDHERVEELEVVCAGWSDSGGPTAIDCQSTAETAHWRFHHEAVLKLCAGLQEENPTANAKPLLEQIGVRSKWKRQPSSGGFSPYFLGAVSSKALESASALSMPFLSAFDDGAWSWVTKHWELKERVCRRRTIAERQAALAQWSGDDKASRIDREELVSSWPANAKDRQRDWTGWWASDADA